MPGYFSHPNDDDLQKMKEAFERHRMGIEEFHHSFQRLFDELDEDQLKTLLSIIASIVESSGSPMAAQFQGMISWALKTRFNLCVTCGKDHSKELLETPDVPASGESERVESQGGAAAPDGQIGHDGQTGQEEQEEQESDLIPPFPRNLLDQYHLDDAYDEDTKAFLGFVCTGINGMKGPCGMLYPSLDDRMLNEPEHCSGCFQRMAQG